MDFMQKKTKHLLNPDLTRPYSKSVTRRLNDSLKKGKIRTFLSDLHEFADAYGMTQLSKVSGLDRSNLYSVLTGTGEPRLGTLHSILNTLGFELYVELKPSSSSNKRVKKSIINNQH